MIIRFLILIILPVTICLFGTTSSALNCKTIEFKDHNELACDGEANISTLPEILIDDLGVNEKNSEINIKLDANVKDIHSIKHIIRISGIERLEGYENAHGFVQKFKCYVDTKNSFKEITIYINGTNKEGVEIFNASATEMEIKENRIILTGSAFAPYPACKELYRWSVIGFKADNVIYEVQVKNPSGYYEYYEIHPDKTSNTNHTTGDTN